MRSTLDLSVEHLPTAVHSIGWIDTVWDKGSVIRRIDSDLRGFKVVGSATLAAASFGLFAFWLSHGLEMKKGERRKSLFSIPAMEKSNFLKI